MTVGFAPATVQAMLDSLPALYVKLHVGDPGAAGTANPAAGSTTRVAVTLGATTSAGVKSLTGTLPSWTNGGTSETLTHISVWDAATGGNFKFSVLLNTSTPWVSGNPFSLTSLTLPFLPVAA